MRIDQKTSSRLITTLVMVLGTVAANITWSSGQTARAACSALPTDKGTVTSTINIPAAGNYRVWSRVMPADSTNNSYYLQVDQTYCAISVGGGSAIPAGVWTWVNYQGGTTSSTVDVNLAQGSHTVVMAGKDANVMVDRLLFVTDTSCLPTGTGDNCATVPATITLSGVTDSQTISGGVPVGATVANASGVTKVDFYVDNTLISSDTTSPYCMAGGTTTCSSFDTTALANGAHTIKATATYSGGTISATASVTVQNTASATPGDVNTDGKVNIFDLSILLSKWSTADSASDLNKDGTVNVFDLSILLSHWTG